MGEYLVDLLPLIRFRSVSWTRERDLWRCPCQTGQQHNEWVGWRKGEDGGREQIVEEFPLYSGAAAAVIPTPLCLKARKEIRPTATADFPSTNRRLMKSSPAVKCFMDKVNRMRAGEAQNFYVCV